MKKSLFIILFTALLFQCKNESRHEKILNLKSLISELAIQDSIADISKNKLEKINFSSQEIIRIISILDSATLSNLKSVSQNSIPNFNVDSNVQNEFDASLEIMDIDKSVAIAMISSWVNTIEKDRATNLKPVERSVEFSASDLVLKINAAIANNCKYVRFYFGEYKVLTSDLPTPISPIAKYLKEKMPLNDHSYDNRFSLIIALLNSEHNLISNSTLINLGGLCPPKCPMKDSIELEDPLWQ